MSRFASDHRNARGQVCRDAPPIHSFILVVPVREPASHAGGLEITLRVTRNSLVQGMCMSGDVNQAGVLQFPELVPREEIISVAGAPAIVHLAVHFDPAGNHTDHGRVFKELEQWEHARVEASQAVIER